MDKIFDHTIIKCLIYLSIPDLIDDEQIGIPIHPDLQFGRVGQVADCNVCT